jgi:hypothetical protein
VLELLQLEKSFYGTVTRGNGDAHIAASVFARLLALPDETVLRVIALVMAETLAAGSVLAEAAGMVIKPDVARWWRLDDTFLDLLKDRTVINALLSEVAGKAVTDANVSETGKVQKKIIRDCLTGEGRERVQGFVPATWLFRLGITIPTRRSKSPRPPTPLRAYLSELGASDSGAAACSSPALRRFRVAEESTARGTNLADSVPRDSPYSSAHKSSAQKRRAPHRRTKMARPMKLLPDPYAVTLRRICLAQALICVSALTSTAVLLSHVVTVMSGLH